VQINEAEFVCSYSSLKSIHLEPRPTIAFIGRSNVGKSSLINHITRRKGLVKTSGTPGKTQLINFFLINKSFYLVDLPGYGFANVPIAVKQQWVKMIWQFLNGYTDFTLVMQILDLRHLPSKEDLEFNKGLQKSGIPFQLIGNKVDKLKKNEIKSQAAKVKKAMGSKEPLLIHSALDKFGKDEILAVMDERIQLISGLE